jgi:hypothetical protein
MAFPRHGRRLPNLGRGRTTAGEAFGQPCQGRWRVATRQQPRSMPESGSSD